MQLTRVREAREKVCEHVKIISELSCASVSKRVRVQKLSVENEFGLHKTEHAGGTRFHMNGLTSRLVLTGRHKLTWKWAIGVGLTSDWLKKGAIF